MEDLLFSETSCRVCVSFTTITSVSACSRASHFSVWPSILSSPLAFVWRYKPCLWNWASSSKNSLSICFSTCFKWYHRVLCSCHHGYKTTWQVCDFLKLYHNFLATLLTERLFPLKICNLYVSILGTIMLWFGFLLAFCASLGPLPSS